jgi:hypothetical protein
MSASFRDRLGSIIMLVFVAVLWGQRNYTTPFGGIFPDRIMIIMTVFVIITLILSFTRYRVMTAAEEKEKDEGGERWSDMGVVISILLLWVLLLRSAGFALLGVAGFTTISWYISGQRKDWRMIVKALALGLAITFLIIFIFGYLLKVPLPQGDIFG